jgi:hypothetical protein
MAMMSPGLAINARYGKVALEDEEFRLCISKTVAVVVCEEERGARETREP